MSKQKSNLESNLDLGMIPQWILSMVIPLIMESLVIVYAICSEKNRAEAVVIAIPMGVALLIIWGFCLYRLKEYYDIWHDEAHIMNRFSREEIKAHLSTCSRYKYRIGNSNIYFSNCMMGILGKFVIAYDDISMVHVSVCKSRYVNLYMLNICLLNGRKYKFELSLKQEHLLKMVHFLYHFNPKILFGYTKNNQKMHNEQVKRYKAGLIVRRKLDLDWANREGARRIRYVELPENVVQQVQTSIQKC